MGKSSIHKSIKKRLGYDADQDDDEVFADWKTRLRRVCKPCWELQYCPYGPLVEQSPILPSERAGQVEHTQYLQECLRTDVVGQEVELDDFLRAEYNQWLDDEQLLIAQVIHDLDQADRFDSFGKIEDPEERIAAMMGNDLPPIHEYRVNFDNGAHEEYLEEDFGPEMWRNIQVLVQKRRSEIQASLDSGKADHRRPMEPARRDMFQAMVERFHPDDYPETVPQVFIDGECSIFGHICPVFFAAEIVTESELERRIGRRHLKFEIMMRIVRRDDYRCQHCKKKLRDDEVEFDHIIPVSKGGSSEEHNMRLTCYDCNRDKSNNYDP